MNYVIQHKANITDAEHQNLIKYEAETKAKQDENDRIIEDRAKKYRDDYYTRQNNLCQQQYVDDLENKKKRIQKIKIELNNIKQSEGSIMEEIKQVSGYVLEFSGGVCTDINYGSVTLKPFQAYFCCIPFKYNTQKSLIKFFLQKVNNDKYYSYDNFEEFIRYVLFLNDTDKTQHQILSPYEKTSCTSILIYKNGKYGLIKLS